MNTTTKNFTHQIKVPLNKGEEKTYSYMFPTKDGKKHWVTRVKPKKAYTAILAAMGYRRDQDYTVVPHPTENALIYIFNDDVKEVDISYFAMLNADKIETRDWANKECPHCGKEI